MPMITIECNPKVLSEEFVGSLLELTEKALRFGISKARPHRTKPYKVQIRAFPQPKLSRGLYDIETIVNYHEEWKFSEEELEIILEWLTSFSQSRFGEEADISHSWRMYSKTGYAGFSRDK